MNLVIALIVLSSAIAIMFSQEFSNGFKKVLALPGMALLLPLFLISYLVLIYQSYVIWGVDEARDLLSMAIHFLQSIVPFDKGQYLFVTVSLVTLTALIPHAIMAYKKKRRIRTTFAYAWLVSFVSWLVLMVFIVTAGA